MGKLICKSPKYLFRGFEFYLFYLPQQILTIKLMFKTL